MNLSHRLDDLFRLVLSERGEDLDKAIADLQSVEKDIEEVEPGEEIPPGRDPSDKLRSASTQLEKYGISKKIDDMIADLDEAGEDEEGLDSYELSKVGERLSKPGPLGTPIIPHVQAARDELRRQEQERLKREREAQARAAQQISTPD